MSVVDSLVYRAYMICDEESQPQEFNYLRHTLRTNGYPDNMLADSMIKMKDRIDQRNKGSQNTTNTNSSSTSKKKGRLILPWCGKPTLEVAGILRFHLDVEIGYIPGRKLHQIIGNTKDKRDIPKAGIYKLPCKETTCDDLYIGQSGRDLTTRMKEHETDVKKANIQTSAVALHAHEKEHEIDFPAATLIEVETRWYHRLFKESLYIRKTEHSMNQGLGMDIHEDYLDLLLPITKDPASIN